jgi:predicted MFS family arabinose efflux permease
VSYFSGAVYGGLGLGPLLGESVVRNFGYSGVWGMAAGLAAIAALVAVWLRDAARPHRTGPSPGLLHPAGLVPGSALGLATVGYAAFASFMPLYAANLGLGASAPLFGLYAGLIVLGRLVGARIPDQLGRPTTARAGLVTMAAGMALISGWRTVPGLWTGTAIFALGNAFLFPALLGLALDQALKGTGRRW